VWHGGVALGLEIEGALEGTGQVPLRHHTPASERASILHSQGEEREAPLA